MENWSEDFLDSFLLTSFFQVDKGRAIHFEDKDYPQLDAADKSDFETIFKRELDKRGYNKDDFEFSTFNKMLEVYVEKLIKLHTNQRGVKNLDDNSIKLAYQFIDFIKAKNEISKKKDKDGVSVKDVTLWDLFRDEKKADLIKKKLLKSGKIIIRVDNKLEFKGFKYEVSSLWCALENLSLINTKAVPKERDRLKMFRDTFEGFDCDERTFRYKFSHKKIDYYETLFKLD